MNNLEDNDTLTQRIIGCAIEVHRTLGPGLLESAYEQCMAHEMTLQDTAFRLQVPTPIEYKGLRLDCAYKADVVSDFASSLPRGHPRHRLLSRFVLSTPSQSRSSN